MSAAVKDGGPAFPIERVTAMGILAHDGPPKGDAAYTAALAAMTRGMTLRDHFATTALQGYLASTAPDFEMVEYAQTIAKDCYHMADAMLLARSA